jgi:putative SOS response-associated peptidase YedK
MATFNARAETIDFRDEFKRTRCLIPMSGYYEWQAPSGKQPWYFTARDGSPLLTAAGLWDEWKDRGTGEQILHDDHHRAQRLRCGNSRPDAGFLTEQQFAPRERTEYLKPVPNDYLQPGQHEGSKAEADDATLIEPVELATA